jgi:tetratricopeptide (TPR) repeat protein
MAVDDAGARNPVATKRPDPTWIVWVLLVVAAAVAVFSATRPSRSPSIRAGSSSAVAKVAKSGASPPAPPPRAALGAEPGALLTEVCGGNSQDCACREKALRRALTLGASESAIALHGGAAVSCQASASMQGLFAEALVRSGKVIQALELLPSIEAHEPKNSSVPYVRSVAALKRGDSAEAAREATRAVDSGRGAPAHVALALASFQDGELDAAQTSLKRALEGASDDVDALYNLAVIDQRRNRYTPARTGYLRVLRVRPDHLDARANLALLALGAGAIDEARHHQRKLEELAPSGDPRALKLAAALSKTKPKAEPLPVVRQHD